MREACKECLFKHLGKAAILMAEVELGYPFHKVYVIGNLSEAEDEIVATYPEIAARIYQFRKAYQRGEDVDIDELISSLYELLEEE